MDEHQCIWALNIDVQVRSPEMVDYFWKKDRYMMARVLAFRVGRINY